MILIPAKIQCDRCDNTTDITFEYSIGAQKIPVMTVQEMPKGWAETIDHGYGYSTITIHLCPDHNKR